MPILSKYFHFFIGREEELRTIIEVINRKDDINFCVIIGVSGVGKTWLAYKYFQENKDNYEYIHWICGKDVISSSVVSSLLKIHTDCSNLDQVKNKLRMHSSLLIFDDIDLWCMIEYLIPNSAACHVLITSCNATSSEWANKYVKVRKFCYKESSQLIEKITGENINEENLKHATLMDYPPVVQLISWYIKDKKFSLNKYLKIKEEEKIKFLDELSNTNQYSDFHFFVSQRKIGLILDEISNMYDSHQDTNIDAFFRLLEDVLWQNSLAEFSTYNKKPIKAMNLFLMYMFIKAFLLKSNRYNKFIPCLSEIFHFKNYDDLLKKLPENSTYFLSDGNPGPSLQ